MIARALLFAALGAAWAAAGAAPRAVCPAPTFAFGDREDDREPVRHTFILENAGDLPLELTEVFSACGCITAIPDQRVIPPGGRVAIEGAIDLRGRRGLVEKDIMVRTNDPQAPLLRLVFTGTVTPPYTFTPSAVFFGALRPDEPQTRSIELVFKPGQNDRVTAVRADDSFLDTAFTELEPGRRYRIDVTARPERLRRGETRRSTVHVLTEHRPKPGLELSAMAGVMSDVIAAPLELLAVRKDGREEVRYILLRPGLVDRFKVLAVDVPDPAMTWNLQPIESGGYRIRIGGLRGDARLDGKKVTIRTDAPRDPVITIPIRVLPEGR